MATVQQVINRSLRLLGQLEAGGSPTSDESNDALMALNAMFSTWCNPAVMTYALREESLTLADGDASYTIGTGGDLNTTRPVRIHHAYILDAGISHPVEIIEDHEYQAIPSKTTESDWPTHINYRPTMPTGTLYVWPVPNATRTLKILTPVPLAAVALVDTVSLPPGWEDAMAYNLAVRIAPEYEAAPSVEVVRLAGQTRRAIAASNSRPLVTYSDLAVAFSPRMPNIEAGY